MLLKKHLCFLLVLSLCGQTAWSQHGLSIKGRVMEQDANIPIAYVSIAIVRNDSIVDGTVSNEEGHFALTTVDDFQVLHVNFIGYEPKVVLRESIDPHKRIEIFLALRQEVLDEVVVAAERTATQQLIDRKVINVGADLQQTGISALEVFDQITEIQTDLGTGQISLRGNSNVLILINGKPSGFSPSELLAQIPSSTIDKIEIITSPSAKYQADG
ncbi:MAG: carboxypeptidase-like regulatory domain-containing protein, partial [Bacteroidota bacterium]